MPEAPEAVRAPIGASAGDILRWVLVSAGAAAFITTMLLALLADGQARSALLGGGIAFVANGYSVWRVFSSSTDVSGAMTLANLYRAEFGKLVITGVLCALAFGLVEDLALGGFLAGLLVTLIAATIGAIFAQRNDVGERPTN